MNVVPRLTFAAIRAVLRFVTAKRRWVARSRLITGAVVSLPAPWADGAHAGLRRVQEHVIGVRPVARAHEVVGVRRERNAGTVAADLRVLL